MGKTTSICKNRWWLQWDTAPFFRVLGGGHCGDSIVPSLRRLGLIQSSLDALKAVRPPTLPHLWTTLSGVQIQYKGCNVILSLYPGAGPHDVCFPG